MITKDKTYRTRDGREVRIYAIYANGIYPVHGAICSRGEWIASAWESNGSVVPELFSEGGNLIEADPHGILQRHRELLASVFDEGCEGYAREVLEVSIDDQRPTLKAALIALGKLDAEKSA